MSITTKTGDTGMTTDGTQKIYKSSHTHYLMAVGKLDQLNSILGLIYSKSGVFRESLKSIQDIIPDIGKSIAEDGPSLDFTKALKGLDESIEMLERDVKFTGIHPITGNESCCLLHLARTICREAELYVWDTIKFQPGKESVGAFMNRLSDLLYLFAEASK